MMKTAGRYAALSGLLLLGATLEAGAVQRRHRPWFSHASVRAENQDSSVSVRQESTPSAKPKIQRNSNPAPSRSTVVKATKGQRVVQQALHYKGTRYRYGGTTKKGMDCSGLVARVWADLKMKKIPRASSALYAAGQPVRLSELRPGDLVFFKNTYKHGISHVGVYTGDNKFIHAANRHAGVTITRLSDPYYQLHYAGARRLY